MSEESNPQPQYKYGDSVYDNYGNYIGKVVWCYYNKYRREWSYTLEDILSKFTGRFISYTP